MEQATLNGFEPIEPAAPAAPNAGNGRPKGARNRKHRALEQAARSRALPLLAKIITAAENSDMQAAQIIMDRIWPRPRTAPIQCELPETKTPADVRAAMLDVIGKVAKGELTADDGAALVSMMRDILDAHSIRTLAPESDNQPLQDVQQVLGDKLARIIEARAVPADPDDA